MPSSRRPLAEGGPPLLLPSPWSHRRRVEGELSCTVGWSLPPSLRRRRAIELAMAPRATAVAVAG
jgi:hypothetical protein